MKENANLKLKYRDHFIFMCIAVFLIWLIIPSSLNYKVFWPETPGPTAISDFFNTTSGLFSGLAFCGVIVTILMQKDELDKTQEQLKKQEEFSRQSARLQALPVLIQNQKSSMSLLLSSDEASKMIKFSIHGDAREIIKAKKKAIRIRKIFRKEYSDLRRKLTMYFETHKGLNAGQSGPVVWRHLFFSVDYPDEFRVEFNMAREFQDQMRSLYRNIEFFNRLLTLLSRLAEYNQDLEGLYAKLRLSGQDSAPSRQAHDKN